MGICLNNTTWNYFQFSTNDFQDALFNHKIQLSIVAYMWTFWNRSTLHTSRMLNLNHSYPNTLSHITYRTNVSTRINLNGILPYRFVSCHLFQVNLSPLEYTYRAKSPDNMFCHCWHTQVFSRKHSSFCLVIYGTNSSQCMSNSVCCPELLTK